MQVFPSRCITIGPSDHMTGASAARQRSLEHATRRARRLEREKHRAALACLGHISARHHSWAEVAPDGAYLAVHIKREQRCPVPPTTRGAVHGFSRQSRSRLLKTMAKIDRNASARALFVTLTYPSWSGTDFTTCKRHLHAWAERFKRRFARGAFIWRMELQKNGTPHYHLIVFGVPYIAHQWVARTWFDVVGTQDKRHVEAGTEIRRVASYRNALAYASKYAAKVAEREAGDTTGRVWGVIGRRHIPIRILEWELDQLGETRLTRFICDVAGRRSNGARKSEYPPRWLIIDGQRAVGAIAWACRFT